MTARNLQHTEEEIFRGRRGSSRDYLIKCSIKKYFRNYPQITGGLEHVSFERNKLTYFSLFYQSYWIRPSQENALWITRHFDIDMVAVKKTRNSGIWSFLPIFGIYKLNASMNVRVMGIGFGVLFRLYPVLWNIFPGLECRRVVLYITNSVDSAFNSLLIPRSGRRSQFLSGVREFSWKRFPSRSKSIYLIFLDSFFLLCVTVNNLWFANPTILRQKYCLNRKMSIPPPAPVLRENKRA